MLDDILMQAVTGEHVVFPEGWTQGRAAFGGLVGALMMARLEAAVWKETGAGRPVRNMSLSFVGPGNAGPMQLHTEITRQGKSVVHAECRAIQNGEIICSMIAAFGAPRESAILVSPEGAPGFPLPDACLALPYIPGVVPEFTRHFDFRWAQGAMPFTGSERGELGGWIRLKETTRPASAAHLLLLLDSWPPAILPMLKGPAPASSMTWVVDFVAHDLEQNAGDWWSYSASTDVAREGYGHTQARMWDNQGRLVTLSRQSVVVFA